MKKTVLSIFIFLLISSCNMIKLGYNNADWLLTWKIDDYFDLTSDQEDFVEDRLEQHLEWHRYNELPRYSAIIDETIIKIEKGITAEDYDWAITQMRDAYKRTILQILPDATTLLMELNPEQIKYYEEKIYEKKKDSSKSEAISQEEQIARRNIRLIERLEEWFGELSERQKEEIKQLAATLPNRRQYAWEDRQRRRKEFLDLIKSKPPRDEFTERLKVYLTDFENGRSEEYKKISASYNEAVKEMVIEMDSILTQQQKEHAFEHIRGYQIDFIELAANE